jgi:hypothetical protein
MAETEIRVRAPNSLLLIGDSQGDIPETMAGQLIAATSTRVAVGTLSELDGETHVRVTDQVDSSPGSQQVAFDGTIAVSSRVLRVESILGDSYLDWPVGRDSVRLQIWVNDRSEPDEISVLVR